MVKLLSLVRLLVTLACLGGGLMMTKQAGAAGMLPPSVVDALHLINDKEAELIAAFN
jgi:hypothetical protein